MVNVYIISLFFQDYKTYLDFVLAMENRKEPQVRGGLIVYLKLWCLFYVN